LLYEKGYTKGAARQQLSCEEIKDDNNQSQQLVRQLRTELEDVLRILKN
jgi:hypothetical protein